MRKSSGTVVVVVGTDAHGTAGRLGRAANVVAISTDLEAGSEERAVHASEAAARAHAPYVVHDADPLDAVADAWVRSYDGTAPRGELEVAVHEAIARWRTGSLDLPDYYFVIDPESLSETRRHWFLGVLHGAAPARVVPLDGAPGSAERALASLATGRWWPDLDRLLDGVDRVVPDRVGLDAAGDAGPRY